MENELMAILQSFSLWQYLFMAGILLVICELIFTEFFLLWIGFACLSTSLTIYVFKSLSGVLWATCLFSLYAIIFMSIGYKKYEKNSEKHESLKINTGPLKLIGQSTVFKIENDLLSNALPMQEGSDSSKTLPSSMSGYVVIHDTRWKVKVEKDQPPCPHLTPVIISGVCHLDSQILIVRRES